MLIVEMRSEGLLRLSANENSAIRKACEYLHAAQYEALAGA